MAITERAVAIGLTGPFGAGCSTAAKILKERLRYKVVLLSDVIRNVWARDNLGKEPLRSDLQALGNQIQKKAENPGEVARLAVEKITQEAGSVDLIVIDGIRNIGEVEFLRHTFGRNFYLIAMECPASERFERLRDVYAEAVGRFSGDNERDRDQEDVYGQQVELCVDAADVIIRNDETVPMKNLRLKVVEYVQVITGATPRYPRPDEILMNLAYSASHGSKCLKRQVGAVLAVGPPLQMGQVVGQGFNENPTGTLPCVHEPTYGANPHKKIPGRCYRDMVRQESYSTLAQKGARCPSCGEPIAVPENEEPPWLCRNCQNNLDFYFWPERAMTLCTAVHAEVAAILVAGPRASGTTLYSTTFPCFQCAEKIVQAGIRALVFTEPYPDIRAAERLELAGIKTVDFEGVRSGRFDEILSRARPYVAQQRRAMLQPAKT